MRGRIMPRRDIEMTTIIAPETTTESDGFQAAYARLVDARNEYDMLRSHGAHFGALVEARGALHRARAEMALVRHGLASQI
jgi:hypothetical protein